MSYVSGLKMNIYKIQKFVPQCEQHYDAFHKLLRSNKKMERAGKKKQGIKFYV